MLRLKEKEIKHHSEGMLSTSKLHAYERMALFLERIKPANLVSRFDDDLKPHEFVFLAEKSIKEEFEYNASQQIYISKKACNQIFYSKNEIIKLLHKTHQEASPNISLAEYKTFFLMNYVNGEDYIADAVDSLKKDVLMLT